MLFSPDASLFHRARLPEQSLWRAVLLQQVLDAKSNSSKDEHVFARRVAHDWLQLSNPDFRMVCDLADLDPGVVVGQLKLAAERDYQWRGAPGDGQREQVGKLQPPASSAARAKLDEKVRRVTEMRRMGMSDATIGQVYRLSPSAINQFRRIHGIGRDGSITAV